VVRYHPYSLTDTHMFVCLFVVEVGDAPAPRPRVRSRDIVSISVSGDVIGVVGPSYIVGEYLTVMCPIGKDCTVFSCFYHHGKETRRRSPIQFAYVWDPCANIFDRSVNSFTLEPHDCPQKDKCLGIYLHL